MDFGANLWAYDKIGKVAGDLPKLPESLSIYAVWCVYV